MWPTVVFSLPTSTRGEQCLLTRLGALGFGPVENTDLNLREQIFHSQREAGGTGADSTAS